MNEIFSDGIADIILSHGLVLIDFFHMVLEKDKPVERVPFMRITLPVEGFFGLFETSETVLNHLAEIGVWKPAPAKTEKKAAPAKKSEAPAKPVAKKPEAPAKKADAKPAPAKAPAKPAPAKAPAKPVAKPAPAKVEAKPAAKKAAAPAKPAPAKVEAKPAAKKAAPPAKAPAKAKKPAK